jgi:hypothetical protein
LKNEEEEFEEDINNDFTNYFEDYIKEDEEAWKRIFEYMN